VVNFLGKGGKTRIRLAKIATLTFKKKRKKKKTVNTIYRRRYGKKKRYGREIKSMTGKRKKEIHTTLFNRPKLNRDFA